MYIYSKISTAIGELILVAQDESLVAILHESESDRLMLAFPEAVETVENNFLKDVAQQITEYLNGERLSFDLPINPVGTEFQKQIWQQLLEIPYGETSSYMEVAQKIGNESAIRAAGTACGANPIPLVIPCHRVMSRDGSLGGFRWGLPTKHKLVLLESGSTDAMEAMVA